jgi:flagellar motor switch protein FliN
MTEGNPLLASKLEVIEEFGRRIGEGLRARCEGAVETGSATLLVTTAAGIAKSAEEGALLARTKWNLEDGEHEGCLLWIGGWDILLGESRPRAQELSADEIAMMDQSLRLILEEEGEGGAPIEWSSLEGIAGAELARRLDFLGASPQMETVQIKLGAGDQEIRFLFIAGSRIGEHSHRGGSAASIQQTGVPGSESYAGEESRAWDETLGLSNLQHLMDVKIPLRIRLGSARMNLEEILRITPGSILELDRREDEPLEVLANGRVIARGQVVVVDERFGLKITEIGAPSERHRETR